MHFSTAILSAILLAGASLAVPVPNGLYIAYFVAWVGV